MNVYVSGMLLNRMNDIYIEYRLGRVLEYKLETCTRNFEIYKDSRNNESKTLITFLYKYIYTLSS